MPKRFDYVIVGSGIAGLYAALQAREHGSVLVVTKSSIQETNTRYAQGGIAAAVGKDDSPELHLQDTLGAGGGLVDERAARILSDEAADRIHDLVELGVPFDTNQGEVALAREGAHSAARVLHAGGDSTGAHIELTLSQLAEASNITVRDYTLATEIVVAGGRAVGLRTLDWNSGERDEVAARHLLLASGGAGQMYLVSTNPHVATGDGIALAYRAGAEVMDMEFFQFHPTALRKPGVRPFLISEAVRGEGAVLLNTRGERFMPAYDPRAELAPRDVVARAILQEASKTGDDHVLLDISHLPAKQIIARFPQIYRFCQENGIDITREPIPVSPAAHYTMGGVRTNDWGETMLPGLYACGECACTGVHGANRLASNSLLETVVFAKRVVQRTLDAPGEAAVPTPDAISLSEPHATEVAAPSRQELQTLMWRNVGIVRDARSLSEAASLLSAWQAVMPAPASGPDYELANLLTCARLATEAALLREESRGAHYRSDFSEPREEWRRHIVFRQGA
ncbi:MAG TPA: L-aspartate oxidase [Dehalococcoidia bacterium]|nr:L-aspartate oxidase [Dehalococcoidia bacterium]